MEQIEKLFEDIFNGSNLVRMVFSAKRKKSLEYSKVTFRPVKIGVEIMFQAEYTYEKKLLITILTPRGLLRRLNVFLPRISSRLTFSPRPRIFRFLHQNQQSRESLPDRQREAFRHWSTTVPKNMLFQTERPAIFSSGLALWRKTAGL